MKQNFIIANLTKYVPKSERKIFKPYKIEEIMLPHPYLLSPLHLRSGQRYLDEDSIKFAEKKYKAACGVCQILVSHGEQEKVLSFDEHKTHIILFLEIPAKAQDLSKIKGLKKYIEKIKPKLKESKINGIAFTKRPKRRKNDNKRR